MHGSEENEGVTARQAIIPFGETPTDKDWKPAKGNLPFEPYTQLPLHEKSVFTYRGVDDSLWLEASAPIKLLDEMGKKMNQIGLVTVSDYVDSPFVKEISRSTGCRVNLF